MGGAARWLAPLFFLMASLAFAAANYPPLTGRVVDQANIIPPSTRGAIETKLQDLEDKSGIQLVVASVNSLDGLDVETYANGLFRAWKLGEAKKNNGVLFLIAPNERKMRIEVGYGLEGTLTDALSKIILTSAVAPRFKAGDYGAGVERGVEGVIEVLSGDSAEWTKRARRPHSTTFDQLSPLIFFALFLFIYNIIAFSSFPGLWPHGFWHGLLSTSGFADHKIWGLMLMAVIAWGPGKLSLDTLVGWIYRRWNTRSTPSSTNA